jgi:hypothetical protein
MINPLKLDFGLNSGSWKLNTAKKIHQFGKKIATFGSGEKQTLIRYYTIIHTSQQKKRYKDLMLNIFYIEKNISTKIV